MLWDRVCACAWSDASQSGSTGPELVLVLVVERECACQRGVDGCVRRGGGSGDVCGSSVGSPGQAAE